MATRRESGRLLLATWIFVIPCACMHAKTLDRQLPEVGPGVSAGPSLTDWHGIRLSAPAAATAIRRALDEASRRLLDPGCQQLLTEFRDKAGHLLSERLAALGVDVRSYLGWIQFHDGGSLCANGWTLMYTGPGSRVVNVCKVAVESAATDGRAYLAAAVIHELLHTLGLEENPPSSSEITTRVKRLCWAKAR
jgi:hypothetical protein